ncbi:MAG: hypothetical protein J6T26_05010 [Firmicutes bacterium]|nr:hypothetical protein [Bacillota bacterium]
MESAKALFSLGPLQVNSQMVTLVVISGLLVLVCYLGTRHMEERPRGLQNLLERRRNSCWTFSATSWARNWPAAFCPIWAPCSC